MSQRARRSAARPPAKGTSNGRAAAVAFFALLPIAVAIGVVVGRGGSSSGENEALLEALRRQDAAVASTPAGTTAASAAKRTSAKNAAKSSKGGGKVVAQTSNGTVHQVTGYKPSQKKVEEDTSLVESNPEQTGKTYIEAQQNLPDVIVVGGDPGSAPPAPGGKGQP